jgi:hypothetical protein
MPKSKHRKNHKQKSAARTQRILNEKRSFEKKQRDFIMQLIEQEKQRGMFDGTMSGMNEFQMPSFSETSENVIEGPTI